MSSICNTPYVTPRAPLLTDPAFPHPIPPHVHASPQGTPGALTAGKSAERQFEGHDHVTQVSDPRHDLHTAVPGVIKYPSAFRIRVAQL